MIRIRRRLWRSDDLVIQAIPGFDGIDHFAFISGGQVPVSLVTFREIGIKWLTSKVHVLETLVLEMP